MKAVSYSGKRLLVFKMETETKTIGGIAFALVVAFTLLTASDPTHACVSKQTKAYCTDTGNP